MNHVIFAFQLPAVNAVTVAGLENFIPDAYSSRCLLLLNLTSKLKKRELGGNFTLKFENEKLKIE